MVARGGVATADPRDDKDDDDEQAARGAAATVVEKLEDREGLLVQRYFKDFLSSDAQYAAQVRLMREREKTTLYVQHGDIAAYRLELAEAINDEYLRYKPHLEKAVYSFIQQVCPDYAVDDHNRAREFFLGVSNVSKCDSLRDLRSNRIGQLCAVSGTVTRTSEVRPELVLGVFECGKCTRLSDPVVQEFKYSQPEKCANPSCRSSGPWELRMDKSAFVDWQKARVQENSTEVPAGSMPRSIEIILRHEIVERAKPGDQCVFTGTLIVVPDVSKLKAPGEKPTLRPGRRAGGEEGLEGVIGLKDLGVRDLTYRMVFLACTVEPIEALRFGSRADANLSEDDMSPDAIRASFTPDELEELQAMRSQPNLVERMRRSIAPSIYGHGDVKLGVLLLLFGGVHKKTKDGINLRGDINVCIVGDPATAKSQFLKYVCAFAPRAVYTSGKASSAVGLTASVKRDQETGEFCIEAGALMLADNGVCCIDEFDKMDDTDQVAIHEAMEQQTISITKAGIQATLNARTSILAAANPIHGRYDRSKTLKANLNVGPAIMSRFDLFFVVLDECDPVNDRIIAEHIVDVHRRRLMSGNSNNDDDDDGGDDDNGGQAPFTPEQLRRYVRFARTIDPVFPPHVQQLLPGYYRRLRQGDALGHNKQAYRITVRQLEALIRLSEALARLHMNTEVTPEYVSWAFRLLKTSIVQVQNEVVSLEEQEALEIDRVVEGGEMEPRPSSPVQMDQDEFEALSTRVAVFVRSFTQTERQSDRAEEFVGVPQIRVVSEMLESMENLTTIELMQQARNKINRVVERLIDRENVLLTVDPPPGYEFQPEDTPSEERRLLLTHPTWEEP